ncbi:Putative multidrug export ATP-binding/permease protein [Candidatus Izimaplasma bacterium HR1]|jgi:ATP-binding cassette subfamily B protein|uniref:ABC transporter ATP-binding protein n=1 Tax=Candidatus Izimoplasma sp. HR1 TaxID=1541959 RepID=UPI0004F763C6|nr:Putative multidrug export ATP-binding/permease protein [Candidatus Izimaplasma bacterium HR1]
MEHVKKVKRVKSVKRINQFLKWIKGYKLIFLISTILLIALQYFRTLSPLFIAHIIDAELDGLKSPLPTFMTSLFTGDTVKERLAIIALVYVSFTLFRVVIMFGRRMINAFFTESVAYHMRNTLYKKLQDLSFSYHTHAETGDLIQRCTTDVETYRVFVGEQLIEIFRLVFLIALTIYQMAKLNGVMTIYSVLITPVIFLTAFIYFKWVKKIFKRVEEAEAKMTTTLQESVTGIRVVKAFAKEKYEIEKFDADSKDYMKEDFHLLKLMAIYWGGTDVITFFQYAITIAAGIVLASTQDLTTGEYIAFLSYIGMIVWPLRQLGRIVQDFGKTTVALDRLDEIMLKESEHDGDSENHPPIKGGVEFRNVGFQFEDDNKPLLKGISFKVEPGESLAIVGKTGSGKSTLINLMIRLLDNQEGSILFDGVDIKDINKKHLRENVGIIMQEPFLYSRTLYDNIGIMDQNASEEKVYKAATIAALHEDILGFEGGYKTIVGERGVTLSGGQKQRVAIARMLLDSKPVLIFDDSLSAVDTETDIQIRRALSDYWKDTTVFIITHRITTAMEADKIIVLDKGDIVEMGTHKELLNQDGLYSELWDIQTNVEYDYKQTVKGVK